MSETDQRDVKWPVIDPRVLRVGVSKLRDMNTEWLREFAGNGEIAVIQAGEEPIGVMVPYALYQTMQATIVGRVSVPVSEHSEENDLGGHESHGGRDDLGPAASPELPHAVCECGHGWTFDFISKRVYCRQCEGKDDHNPAE